MISLLRACAGQNVSRLPVDAANAINTSYGGCSSNRQPVVAGIGGNGWLAMRNVALGYK